MAEGVMRAVRIAKPGGPEVLELVERPLPVPGAGEVRVRVAASGVNRADLIQRRGRYPAPPGWPADIPGLEYAGTVEVVGEGVSLEPGQRVMGIVGGGGYAEAVVVREREVVRAPEGMDPLAAGAVPEVFMTAWDALFTQMGLTAGETVLVHAAGSGVGTAAVQLARAAGARVIGTSRTPEKLHRAAALGLEVGVAGAEWPDAVLEATGGEGADVILDLVGAGYLPRNLKCVAVLGRIVVVGLTGGAFAEIDLGVLLRKRVTLVGTSLRSRPLEEKVAAVQAFARHALPLFADGRIRPVLDETFPMADAAGAHRRMEADQNFGKIVLVW